MMRIPLDRSAAIVTKHVRRNRAGWTFRLVVMVIAVLATVPAASVAFASCGDGVVDVGEACDDENAVAGDGCSDVCQVELCWGCAGEPSVCAPNDGASCDDGVFCNGTDTCDAGGCSLHTGDPCPGPD